LFSLLLSRRELDDLMAGWERFLSAQIAETVGEASVEARGLKSQTSSSPPPVGLVILMEGADGVRFPDELPEWYEAGVRVIGPAWAGTRYAGGTNEPGGFTHEGRDLLERMAELGICLDISHLAEQAALEALDTFQGELVATHSNARTLLRGHPFPDRHLSDEIIVELANRGGVIGIVPFNRFLKVDWCPEQGRQGVGIEYVVAHIDHVCQLVGDADHVGIGTDFEGGFGLDQVPEGLDSVADLRLIGEALEENGYSTQETEAILGGNWLEVLKRILPE
jgi:membrane dipeptidase